MSGGIGGCGFNPTWRELVSVIKAKLRKMFR